MYIVNPDTDFVCGPFDASYTTRATTLNNSSNTKPLAALIKIKTVVKGTKTALVSLSSS